MTEEELQQRRERHELEMEKIRASVAQMYASVEQMRITNDKTLKETDRVIKEARWYEVVIASGATLALVAVAKLLL
ncbi:MAG: hypothetical protein ACFBWO_16570 [Paracoccaceae bacterium]